MIHTVYFTDRALIITDSAPRSVGGEELVVDADREEVTHRAKILKMIENYKTIFMVSVDPDRIFDLVASEFACVEAAGGVVVDREGRWLMMHRNGRWDFPKGHIEAGESREDCAVREIEEETGVRGRIERELCSTLHAYFFPPTQRWELKRTYWYALEFVSTPGLKPQEEEGIHEVVWLDREEALRRAMGSFPTIRRVAEAMER